LILKYLPGQILAILQAFFLSTEILGKNLKKSGFMKSGVCPEISGKFLINALYCVWYFTRNSVKIL